MTPLEKLPDVVTALGWFLDDDRFQVAVGGNPNAVETMIADAQRIYLAALKAYQEKENT